MLALCQHDKAPEKNKLKEKMFILIHSFRGFGPQSDVSIAMDEVMQNIMERGCGEENLFMSWPPRSRKKRKLRELRSGDKTYSSKPQLY